MHLVRAAALVGALALPVAAQDMAGIRLGEPLPRDLGAPHGEEVVPPHRILRWQPENGLVRTVVAHSDGGAVLLVQLARSAQAARPAENEDGAALTPSPGPGPSNRDMVSDSPISGVRFGETTLDDLTRRFGGQGQTYPDRPADAPGGGVASYLVYGISGTDGMLVFAAADAVTPDAVLDTIILADRAYLETIWGTPAPAPDSYMPIPDPTF